MFKALTLTAAALASVATGLAATPAAAQRYDRDQAYQQAYRDGYNRDEVQYDNRGYDQRGYDNRGYDNRRGYDDRRYYDRDRRCRTGATGSIIGAIAGGLLGNAIAGRGDRTLGTVLGAGGGALAGHAIEKDGRPGYCR